MTSEPHVVGQEGIAALESPAGEPVIVKVSGDESGVHTIYWS